MAEHVGATLVNSSEPGGMEMRTFRQSTMMACAAVACLAAFAATASADRQLGVEPGAAVTLTSVGQITFTASNGVEVFCNVVLRGEIARTVSKAAARTLPGGRIGQITRATVEECTGSVGSPTVQLLAEAETPYNLRYDAFLGTLPDISGVLVTSLFSGVSVRFSAIVSCLYQGETGLLITFPPSTEGGGLRYNRVRFLGNTLRTTDAGCPTQAMPRGEFRATPFQRLTLR